MTTATLRKDKLGIIKPSDLAGWFDDALKRTDPRPSEQAIAKLAEAVRVAINREESRKARVGAKAVPLEGLKDLSPDEEFWSRFRGVTEAADHLLWTLDQLRGFEGPVAVPFEEVATALAPLGAIAAKMPAPMSPGRGRPVAAWHSAGRQIAKLVQHALKGAAYEGRMLSTDEESPVAQIGAKIISAVYGSEIAPAGFATAMKARSRTKQRARSRSVLPSRRPKLL